MTRKLLDGAHDALGAAAGVARHLLWYVSYHVDGRVRDFEDPGTGAGTEHSDSRQAF